jgi:hypothetical protein
MTQTDPNTFDSFGFPELERTSHSRRCSACKLLLQRIVPVHDAAVLVRAKITIIKHQYEAPADGAVPCRIITCVQHDTLPLEVATAAIRVGGGERPIEFGGRSRLARASLTQFGDHKDIWMSKVSSHYYPGEVILRLTRGESRVHVVAQRALFRVVSTYSKPLVITPSTTTGLSLDVDSLWSSAIEFDMNHLPKLRESCRAAYARLKELAELEAAYQNSK